MFSRHEQLVAEIAGETGARNGDLLVPGTAIMREFGNVENLQPFDVGETGVAQHCKRSRTLQGQTGDGFGFFLHDHLEAYGAVEQPGQMPLLRAQPEPCRRKPEQRAVVENESRRRRTRRCSGRGQVSVLPRPAR